MGGWGVVGAGGKPEMAYTYLPIGLFGVAMSPRTTGTGHRPRQS